jgi:segregation and condensation protein B
MSLKAKIEAVIYASEEPVTLAQLMGLLGQEAQSELDRMESRQESLGLDGFEPEPVVVAEDPVEPEPAEESAPEAEAAPDTQPSEGEVPEPTAAEKRGAREKTREQERVLRDYFRELLARLIAEYSTSERGIEIREVAGGYRMATKPEYHDTVRGFVKSLKPPLKLTLQALETLAVVAYKQPITAPEVSEIRGVDSSGVLGSLMTRKLVTTAGRKQVIGRPILYKTTKDFLLRFGLKDIAELPSIEEFEKLAGELADAEPMQKEIPIPMPETEREAELQAAADMEEEREATEPQADGDSTALDEMPSEAVVEAAEGVDGRVSGPPPNYDAVDEKEDSPARDAAIQADEARDEGL